MTERKERDGNKPGRRVLTLALLLGVYLAGVLTTSAVSHLLGSWRTTPEEDMALVARSLLRTSGETTGEGDLTELLAKGTFELNYQVWSAERKRFLAVVDHLEPKTATVTPVSFSWVTHYDGVSPDEIEFVGQITSRRGVSEQYHFRFVVTRGTLASWATLYRVTQVAAGDRR